MTLGIEAKGLELRYGAVTALDDLRFHLTGGRIYGLLGRNGSGKTSLLSVLAGFRKASGGTVLVDGQPVFENPRVTRRVCLIRETGDTGEHGVYLVYRLLPVLVAHGRTRREFLQSVALFVVAAGAVVAALLTAGWPSRASCTGSWTWPQRVAPERLFDAPTRYPRIFLTYWAMLVVWTTIGLLLAAGFYRSGGNEPVVLALALVMVVVTGFGIGFNGLPFVGAVVDVADLPLAGSLALCLAALLPGAAVTWALVRDLPIRNRTA